jgi:SAM-dependent methyltransferase
MALPDASRLSSLSSDTWRALGVRLRSVGLTAAALDPVARVGAKLPPGARGAIRGWHLQRQADPLSYALRMLCFADPVTPAEAHEALGDLVEPLVLAGFLGAGADERVVSPFVLGIVADLYVVSDDLAHGGEAVMGLGAMTNLLCRAGVPERGVKRALDVGCGAGTGALALARRAASVVGTDVSERAVTLARVNAAINGITNVEFRAGDLFAPVAGEGFDLVISHPPGAPQPDAASAATWLHGGRRGDELSRRLLADLEPHLAPGGRAVLVLEWADKSDAVGAGDAVTGGPHTRVRAALPAPSGSALAVLVLQSQTTSADEHAVGCAATLHPRLDAHFDAEVRARRDHLEHLGIGGLTLLVAVVQRTDGAAWTNLVPVLPLGVATFSGRRLDKLVAARAVAADPEKLLAASLSVPAGTMFAEEQDGPGAEQPSRIEARPPRDALIPPVNLTPEGLGLLTFIHEAPTVRAGLQSFAEALEVPLQKVLNEHLLTVTTSLLAGLLEIASPPGLGLRPRRGS